MNTAKRRTHKESRAGRRQGVHVVLPENLTNAVRQLAAARRVPVKAIYEAAVTAYISPGAQDQRDAMLSRHLNRFSRAVESVDWSAKLLIAMLRYQIELDLSFLPEPSTEEERRAVTEKGARRFDRFEQWLTRNLEEPVAFQQRVQREVTAAEGQFTNEPH